jgi:hypothetical protein
MSKIFSPKPFIERELLPVELQAYSLCLDQH